MLKNELKIAGTTIGGNASPYIIAEVGSNFDKNIDKAKRLIDVLGKLEPMRSSFSCSVLTYSIQIVTVYMMSLSLSNLMLNGYHY